MSATYTSFDTLTIGQWEGSPSLAGPPPGSELPVLAEIPTILPPSKQRPEQPQHQFETSHELPPAPRFAATVTAPEAPTETSQPPAPQPVQTQPAIKPTTREPIEWEESGWGTWLLEIESTLRPHARLIVLLVLIALTGLTLVLLRSPVIEPIQPPVSDVVATPQNPAETVETQVASTKPAPSATVSEVRSLAPLPAIPANPLQATAEITAVGPASMPVSYGDPSLRRPGKSIVPVEPYRRAEPQSAARVAQDATPAKKREAVRLASKPSYPSTSAPSAAWSPESNSGQRPPVAELMPPYSPNLDQR